MAVERERRGKADLDQAFYAPKDPAISAFVTELHYARGRSPRTCEAYARDLEFFAAFLERSVTTAERADVKAFVLDLAGKRRYQPAAIRRKLVALRRFYRYLAVEGIRSDDPMAGIEPPKLPKRLPVVLKEDEVARLLRTPAPAGRTDFQRLRDRAILEVLYASGIRRAEVASLNLYDVDLDRRVMRVTGKGNKQRTVLINEAATDAMRAYLGHRPRTSDEAFFVGRQGKRLGVRAVWSVVKQIERLSGMAVHATPHVMRHSFATHLLENGADIMTIKELLGHESLATTQIYTNVSIEHMRKTYESAHPRDKRSDR
ncbi:MAG: tyrosine-type recombinase/integrase [Candidatus Eremiobacteraeota bacterium]|nr:tyrosine-type recombinase/integrase [Candidatus Eremiobacteraeota bacterium]